MPIFLLDIVSYLFPPSILVQYLTELEQHAVFTKNVQNAYFILFYFILLTIKQLN